MAVKNVHKSPPKGKPKNRSQYADPKNLKWPIDGKHIRAAVGYFNHGNHSGYSGSQWATVGRRIAGAARRLLGGAYKFASGKIVTPNNKAKGKAATAEISLFELALAEVGTDWIDAFFADLLALPGDGQSTDGDLDPDGAGQDEALEAFLDERAEEDDDEDERAEEDGDDDDDGDDAEPGERDDDEDDTRDPDASDDQQNGKPGKRKASASAKAKGKQQQKQQKKPAATEEWDGVDLLPGARVVLEDTTVNGVPCFTWEAMAIPADAVSRNTVPGNKGPTYYSGRRMHSYFTSNQRMLEEAQARGQHITVYPRHAAALMDMATPLGWVSRYFLRPSATRSGLEDMWYVGTAPLTTEGADTRMKMQSGLIRYSSLRTMPKPHFRSEPIKLNGQIVEEAVELPIAGIDLVATSPGLPVAPIRVLEEAHLEALEEPAPPQSGGTRPGAPTSAKEKTGMTRKCPHCQGDISAAVEEETTDLTAKLDKAQKKVKKLEELAAAAPKSGANGASEERIQALEAQVQAIQARAEAAEAKAEALDAVRAQVEKIAAQNAVEEATEKLLKEQATKDKALAEFLAPLVYAAIEEGNVTDAAAVPQIFYGTMRDHVGEYYAKRATRPAGFGYVHMSATEEGRDQYGRPLRGKAKKNTAAPAAGAGAQAGQNTRDESDDDDTYVPYGASEEDDEDWQPGAGPNPARISQIQRVMGRLG